jgi:hypothetical protein
MPDAGQRQKLKPFVGKFVKATDTVYKLSGRAPSRSKRLTKKKSSS